MELLYRIVVKKVVINGFWVHSGVRIHNNWSHNVRHARKFARQKKVFHVRYLSTQEEYLAAISNTVSKTIQIFL